MQGRYAPVHPAFGMRNKAGRRAWPLQTESNGIYDSQAPARAAKSVVRGLP